MPKDNTPFPPGALVAGYFRDSGGDEQDLSVERQIGEFRRWLVQLGHPEYGEPAPAEAKSAAL